MFLLPSLLGVQEHSPASLLHLLGVEVIKPGLCHSPGPVVSSLSRGPSSLHGVQPEWGNKQGPSGIFLSQLNICILAPLSLLNSLPVDRGYVLMTYDAMRDNVHQLIVKRLRPSHTKHLQTFLWAVL